VVSTADSQPKPLTYSSFKLQKFQTGDYVTINSFESNKQFTHQAVRITQEKIGEFLITKYNKNHKKIWQKVIYMPQAVLSVTDIKTDDSQNIWFVGSINDLDNSKLAYFILKLNKKGEPLWSKIFEFSNDFNLKNSSMHTYLNSENQLNVLLKTNFSDNDSLYQISLLNFDKKGNKINDYAAEISNETIGSSVDNNGNLYILCAGTDENKMEIQSVVKVNEIFQTYQNVQQDIFQIENDDFSENVEQTDSLFFSEIKYFNEKFQNSKNLKISISTNAKTGFLKIKKGNATNSNSGFLSFLGASISHSTNLWNTERNIETLFQDEELFTFYSKNYSEKEELKFKTENQKAVKMKTEKINITNLNYEIFSLLNINAYFLNSFQKID
jgi:hypothetical protein